MRESVLDGIWDGETYNCVIVNVFGDNSFGLIMEEGKPGEHYFEMDFDTMVEVFAGGESV